MKLADASRNGNLQEVKQLLESKADINRKNLSGNTALIEASIFGHEKVVSFLLENKPELELKGIKEMTALAAATYYGYFEIVKLLVEAKSDISAKEETDSTPLILAANNIDRDKHDSCCQIAEYLLKQGADIKAANELENTALMAAIWQNNLEVVKILMNQKEKNLEARNNVGVTALVIAAICTNRDLPEIVLILLENGANPNTFCDEEGNTLLSVTQKIKHFVSANVLENFFRILNLKENLSFFIPGIMKLIIEYEVETEISYQKIKSSNKKEIISMTPLLDKLIFPSPSKSPLITCDCRNPMLLNL